MFRDDVPFWSTFAAGLAADHRLLCRVVLGATATYEQPPSNHPSESSAQPAADCIGRNWLNGRVGLLGLWRRRPAQVMRDRDGKFSRSSMRCSVLIKTPVRSPRANAFAERFVGTLRRECLDHLLIYGEGHLRTVLAEYERHFNDHRPHQSRSLRPQLHDPSNVIDMTAPIYHRRTVTELINENHRAA
jgi:hypothetical protein